MAMGEDIGDEPLQGQIGISNNDSHDNQTLFIMDSIIKRLKPKDSHHVKDMINQRGLLSGALLMTSVLFWWIAINKGGDQVNDSNIPLSMIGQFEFQTLSIVVAAIIFLATLVMIMGREKGNATISNLGGLLIVLGIFYIIEPLILHFDELGAESAIFASGRLFGLATMVFLASKFFFDALLLQWVSTSMMNMGIDVLPHKNYSDDEGHADEENPYA
ncbi:MAG: hypothetical protein ACKVI6_02970 [Candidatus Poseidoniales archaeon]|jgi:hypothetical protein|tara:strand:- start:78 stop:728 length:651 start_codon:yes stop_codon:yes gene_type:complete